MRRARVKAEGDAFYHVMSRCALQEFLLTDDVKEMFMKMLRRAERFSGVRIIDYCVMDDHFHLLVKVPKRHVVTDDELDARIKILYGERKAEKMFGRWKLLLEAGAVSAVEKERDSFRRRMYDLSEFMKTFKQRFSLWYCSNHGDLEGTIWQGPFHSVLVEGKHDALGSISAYIVLNPVRAWLVAKPEDYVWSGFGAACRGDGAAKAALISESGGKRPAVEKWTAFRERIKAAAERLVAIRLQKTAGVSQTTGEMRQEPRKGATDVAKALGIALRDRDVSRGVAFGTEAFVRATIVSTSRTAIIRTRTREFCGGENGTLYCAGRRRA